MSYYKRNQRWLLPFIGTFVLCTTPFLMAVFAEPLSNESKSVLAVNFTVVTIGLVLGGMAVAIGAWLTNTFSANVVQVLVCGVALGATLTALGFAASEAFIGSVAALAVTLWAWQTVAHRRSK